MSPMKLKLSLAPSLLAVSMVFVSPLMAADKAPNNAALDQRLQRVERILDNQVLLEMLQRMDSLQSEVRQLRGEVERLNHEQGNLSKRQRDLYLDTDRRLQSLEEGGGTGLEALLPGGAAVPTDGTSETSPEPTVVDATEVAPLTEAPAPASAVEQRAQAKEGEKQAYDEAYDTLMAGNNELAVERFESYLDTYPDGPFSDNALYWRGEAHYVSRQFDDAIASFNDVISRFPDSSKIPDARLKIAYAYYEQGKKAESKAALETLVQEHPQSTAARLAQRRLNAMSE